MRYVLRWRKKIIYGLISWICILGQVSFSNPATQALAPPSALQKQEEAENALPAPLPNPTERFLRFLNDQRALAALGGDSCNLIIDTRQVFVLSVNEHGVKRQLPLPIPAWVRYFMDEHNLMELRLPIRGLYRPLVEKAVADARLPALLRYRTSRRGFLGLLAAGAKFLAKKELSLGGWEPLIRPISAGAAPLSRAQQLAIGFGLDRIMSGILYKKFPRPGRALGVRVNFDKESELDRLADTENLSWHLSGLQQEVKDLLALGIGQDPALVRDLQDAIIYSAKPPALTMPLLAHVNELFPEHAVSPRIVEMARGTPVPSGSVVHRRRRPGLWRDLEHLEQDALIWHLRASPNSPEYHLHFDWQYALDRLEQLNWQGAPDDWSPLDLGMWEIMPGLMRHAGGLSWEELLELRRIAKLYRGLAGAIEQNARAPEDPLAQAADAAHQHLGDAARQLEDRLRKAVRDLEKTIEDDIFQHERSKHIEHIVYDLDGTIINVIPIYRRHFAFVYWKIMNGKEPKYSQWPAENELEGGLRYYDRQILGHSPKEKMAEIVAQAGWRDIAVAGTAEEYYQSYADSRDEELIRIAQTDAESLLVPGIKNYLQRRHALGKKQYIASVAPVWEAKKFILEKAGLLGFFEEIHFCKDLAEKLAVLERIKTSKEIASVNLQLVDDSPLMIQAVRGNAILKDIFIIGLPASQEDRQAMAGTADAMARDYFEIDRLFGSGWDEALMGSRAVSNSL